MTQAFLTFAVPFDASRAGAVEDCLEAYAPRLLERGDLRDVLRRQGLHFMSITVVPGDAGTRAHLLVEMSVDGGDATGQHILGTLLDRELRSILSTAGVDPGASVPAFLARHRIRTGQGLFDVPGLDFCGTPGMSVLRIRDEHALVRRARDLLDRTAPPPGPALARLRWIRRELLGPALPEELHHLREPEPVVPLSSGSGGSPGILGALGVGLVAVWTLLWPVLLLLGALVLGLAVLASGHGLVLAFSTFVASSVVAVLLVATLALFLYRELRRLEEANQPDESLPDPALLEEIVAHENRTLQNHLACISVMQPGWLRPLTLRLAFRVIGLLAVRSFRPGFLGEIGTIHFARWVVLPGTNRLLFFSNYGGSWESYLEDFITKAANGLTGVWSNTIGFPRTENLFQKGATDGDRFKRWARRQQRPTRFWYSAYPHLTTARIHANAAIRQGLLTALTDDEAEAWFSLIGSASRPAAAIETTEVQSLFFGGLKYHPASACVICAMPEAPVEVRAWLARIEPLIRFGEEVPRGTVHVLGLSAGALRALGLPHETLEQFPLAFRQGMAHPSRSHILSDTGDDKPATWLWGAAAPRDAVLNVYAENQAALESALAVIAASLQADGGRILHTVRLAPPGSGADGQMPMREPFGFVDGVSQPIVRGTRRWMRDADEIHAVDPGEFLYGYPDNRGYLPLSPRLRASADPANMLAVIEPRHSSGLMLPNFSTSGANADRDFGRNGTFLVIRQFEQDVEAFNRYLAAAAREVEGQPGVPPGLSQAQLAEWIGAKMVGRWKDGTSVVRFPHRPGSGWNGQRGPVAPDNDFLMGAEDPMGLRCPFGAHIRRTNPRDSFSPGSTEQLSIVNRHRILRRGRTLDADGSGDPASTRPGLLFMCLNIDIERQFEFIQQTWAMALQFHGLENEVDAILSRGGRSARLTVPTAEGPLMIRRMDDFVRVRGGGYFFMPGRRTLRYLARLAD